MTLAAAFTKQLRVPEMEILGKMFFFRTVTGDNRCQKEASGFLTVVLRIQHRVVTSALIWGRFASELNIERNEIKTEALPPYLPAKPGGTAAGTRGSEETCKNKVRQWGRTGTKLAIDP